MRYLALLPLLLLVPADEPTDAELAKKPITTVTYPVGQRLRAWGKEGTAAGLVGVWYDNRDRGHSDLPLATFPQLRQVTYTKAEFDARLDWALQPRVLPKVVFGNSSTSAPPEQGGSNVRVYYCSGDGLRLLEKQYLGNNLYVYPEHKDHDPGRNGVPDGYGDVYPTNTPYLLASQGSSGSDRPFMLAVAYTLAAFKPAVRKKLVETGLLMPTVQMLVRSTSKHITRPAQYYEGAAHPTVFNGEWVDHDKLIDRAHAMRLETIPPMVKLEVVEEEKLEVGKDYFELLNMPEQLADTGSVIARIWRGHQRTRRMVVSAEKSYDVNKYPLTYRWEVLRGDPKRVKITPRNKAGSRVEILVEYHERRPIAAGSPLESNRVDVGVFVHNGDSPSAPGFVTYFTLDNEARSYDAKGRIVEMNYGMGFTALKLGDIGKVLPALAREGLAAKALGITAAERLELTAVSKELATTKEPTRGKFLDARREALGGSVRQFLDKRLNRDLKTPLWWNEHRDDFTAATNAQNAPRIEAARQKILQLGVVTLAKDKSLVLQPVHSGKGDPASRLSAFEMAMLEEFNARLLTDLVLPGLVTATFRLNFVDPRVTANKPWRDVYVYRGDKPLGWRRHLLGDRVRIAEFTPEGWLVMEKDKAGRAIKARTVTYAMEPLKTAGFANTNPILQFDGDEVITFEYVGEERKINSRVRLPRDSS